MKHNIKNKKINKVIGITTFVTLVSAGFSVSKTFHTSAMKKSHIPKIFRKTSSTGSNTPSTSRTPDNLPRPEGDKKTSKSPFSKFKAGLPKKHGSKESSSSYKLDSDESMGAVGGSVSLTKYSSNIDEEAHSSKTDPVVRPKSYSRTVLVPSSQDIENENSSGVVPKPVETTAEEMDGFIARAKEQGWEESKAPWRFSDEFFNVLKYDGIDPLTVETETVIMKAMREGHISHMDDVLKKMNLKDFTGIKSVTRRIADGTDIRSPWNKGGVAQTTSDEYIIRARAEMLYGYMRYAKIYGH